MPKAVVAATDSPRPDRASGFLDIYGTSYAFGLLFLIPAILLVGSQPLYSFTTFYTAMLAVPPIAASVCLLATEPTVEGRRRILSRSALLIVFATTGSILAIMVGAPVVILLFREGVGHSQATTGLVSAAGLVLVSAPMLWSLVNNVRAGAWARTVVLLLAIAAMVVVLALTLAGGGFLVDSMRRDQAQIMMGLLEWGLPAFALTTGFVRHSGLV